MKKKDFTHKKQNDSLNHLNSTPFFMPLQYNQGFPKNAMNRLQPKPGVPNLSHTDPNKPPLTKQMNMMGGNVPSTVKAFQARVADMRPSLSPGPSQSHVKDKKKFESLK